MQAMITPRAGLQPEFEQIELLAMSMPGASLKEVLERFASDSRLDGSFFFCDLEDSLAVAETLDQVGKISMMSVHHRHFVFLVLEKGQPVFNLDALRSLCMYRAGQCPAQHAQKCTRNHESTSTCCIEIRFVWRNENTSKYDHENTDMCG